jgi:ABC-2 type transport system permease protein
MKFRRVGAVARKEFLHVIRDFRSLAMAILIPMMMLILFGFALTLDVDHVPMAVWDQSGTARSRDFISRFGGSPYFLIRKYVGNDRDLIHAIDTGEVMMGLVVPRDFAQRIDAGRDVPVQISADGADANTATIALNYASVIAQTYALEIDSQRSNRRGMAAVQIPLDVRPRVLFNEEMESRNYIIPGLIAVLMMVIAAMLTSLTIAREWERGTMEQLISTPVKVSELILGKLLPYFAIGLFDVLVAVLMGEFVFHVPLRGNVALLFGTASIFLVGALAMGMTISIVTKNQLLSSQVAMVATFLPSFLLSGFIFTIANMPQAIQIITYIVPARYFIAILKGIYLKGVGWEILGLQIFLLTIYGVVMVTLANVKLRKKLT